MNLLMNLSLLAATPPVSLPLVFFAGDRLAIADRIATECVSAGQDVDRKDDREIVCSKPVGGLKGAWAKFGVGRASSDDPSRQRVRFTISPRDGRIEVGASRDIGPGKKPQAWDINSANAVTGMMTRAGGKLSAAEAVAPIEPRARTSGPLVVSPSPQ